MKKPQPAYESLAAVLNEAFEQAVSGKGQDRHATDEPFERQTMLAITAMVGVGFPLGQAQKKAQEAARFVAAGDLARAKAEILGAINYLAGAAVWVGNRH